MHKHLLSHCARFHLSRPLRKCKQSWTPLPQSMGVKFSLVKDNQGTFFVLPTVPIYHDSKDVITNSASYKGKGVWVAAKRGILTEYCAHKKKHKNVRGHLYRMFKHKLFNPEDLIPSEIVIHDQIVQHIEASIILDCYYWYKKCIEMNVENIINGTLSGDLFQYIQERTIKLKLSSDISWLQHFESDQKRIQCIRQRIRNNMNTYEKIIDTIQGDNGPSMRESMKESMKFDEDAIRSIEYNDPRVGLVVAFQRMDFFRSSN
jgi:hypothetical protein